MAPLFKGQLSVNKTAITDRYKHENDFYRKFLDPNRCYLQALFERDDEPFETAQRHKSDYVVKSCELNPGDRVLDVGERL